MTARPPGVDVGVALRRVVVGYRAVGVAWLWLLAAIVLATEDAVRAPGVVATMAAVGAWAAVTSALAAHRPAVLRSWAWLAADLGVAAATVLAPAAVGADRGFAGGYPFSAVLLAAYARGAAGGLAVATVLAVVAALRLGVGDAIGAALIYLAGSAVAAWGIAVIRRDDAARRALEERLAGERAERIRSQERAETGAVLHDSVLQTLALIQRRAGDPAQVAALARRQERELRDWLSGARSRLGDTSPAAAFAQAVAGVAAEVERDTALTVEVVTVGDAPLDDRLGALVDATREALRNAAAHAGVATAAVYAEATPTQVSVFVRDRGAGFDVAAVPADRRGIAESIVGRLHRCGGAARVRSTPGDGTEVELVVPRDGPAVR